MMNSGIFLLFALMVILNAHFEKKAGKIEEITGKIEEITAKKVHVEFEREKIVLNHKKPLKNSTFQNGEKNISNLFSLHNEGMVEMGHLIARNNRIVTTNKKNPEPKKIILYSIFGLVFLALGAMYKLGITFKMQTL